jgi:ATP-dependent DNA helicase RecQ
VATSTERLQIRESNSGWLKLAHVYLMAGENAAAMGIAQRLTALPEPPAPAWNLLGDTHLRLGQVDADEAAYLQCLKLAPGSRLAYAGLAEVHLRRGRAVSAAAYAVRAFSTEEVQYALPVELLRRLRGYFEATGDSNRLAEIDDQLAVRFAQESHELGRLLAEALSAAPAGARADRTPAVEAQPVAALPVRRTDPGNVAISEAERTELLAAASEHFGFTSLLPAQAEIMACVRRGEDVLAVLPTGAGKSLCYLLPALMDEGLTLVISPLIALMKDQIDNLPEPARRQAVAINSSLEGAELRRAMAAVAGKSYRLVYAAP